MQILIIDHNSLFADRLMELFAENDPRIRAGAAYKEEEVLKWMEKGEAGLILLDLDMAYRNEYRLLKLLKERSPRSKICIVYTIPDDYRLARCRKSGVIHSFDKYLDFENIPAVLAEWFPGISEGTAMSGK